MKVTEVSVQYCETRSANFQGRKVGCGLTVKLDEGEDQSVVRGQLMAICVNAVRAEQERLINDAPLVQA